MHATAPECFAFFSNRMDLRSESSDPMLPGSITDRRIAKRFTVRERLLVVGDDYSGEIFDIGRSGFFFQIAFIRLQTNCGKPTRAPGRVCRVDIFHPATGRHILRNLNIERVSDLYAGPMYAGSGRVVKYRRGVKFDSALSEQQMQRLHPFLEEIPHGMIVSPCFDQGPLFRSLSLQVDEPECENGGF